MEDVITEFSREEHLKKIGFKTGYTPWNKGLKIGKSGMSGKKHKTETKRLLSENSPRFWKGKKFSERHKTNLSVNHADFNSEKSPNWKGTNVKNIALHQWVAAHKGRLMCCEHCGDTTRKIYDWANKDHKYERNLNDYIRLCRSCHRKYDIENNNYNTKKRYYHMKMLVPLSEDFPKEYVGAHIEGDKLVVTKFKRKKT